MEAARRVDRRHKAGEMSPAVAHLDQAARPTYDAFGSRTEQTEVP